MAVADCRRTSARQRASSNSPPTRETLSGSAIWGYFTSKVVADCRRTSAKQHASTNSPQNQGDAPAQAAFIRLGRQQQQEEQQREREAAAREITSLTTRNTTPPLTWTQILETKGTVPQHLTIIWNKLTTTQKIGTVAIVVVSLLLIFRNEAVPSESVYVKYRGEVNLKSFDCKDIARSSFIKRVCYDGANEYMLINLNGTYYHYCAIDDDTVTKLLAANSMGRFYNTNIKGNFDCRKNREPRQ